MSSRLAQNVWLTLRFRVVMHMRLPSFFPPQVHETIEDIETHFRKVGLTAVRIGQSLSQTEFQRQKAEHAQKLLEYFLAFETLNYDAMLKDAESERIEMLSNDILAPLVQEENWELASGVSFVCVSFAVSSMCSSSFLIDVSHTQHVFPHHRF